MIIPWELIRVDAQRDLGVLTTCDARFNEHICAHVNKANKMLGFIRPTISISEQYLPTLRPLHTAVVRSHLDCASQIWSPLSISDKASGGGPTTCDNSSPARAKLQ